MSARARDYALALAASVALHVALIAGFAYALHCMRPAPDVWAQLDVARVDLSLSEQKIEKVALAPLPSASAIQSSPQPHVSSQPPDAVGMLRTVAPRQCGEAHLPDPDEERPQMVTPPADAGMCHARVEVPPRPSQAIRTVYPRAARRRGEQGVVTLELTVDEEGRVGLVTVVASSGFPDLDAAAKEAVAAAHFVPAQSDGKPVSSSARLNLEFKLE